jgi:uncharacterized OB-fold protein
LQQNSMSNSLITAGAVYVPGCTQPTRRGSRRVCAADEDAVTMAVEVANRALASWGRPAQAVDALIVALRQSEERVDYGVNPEIIRQALGLASQVRATVLSGADELSGAEALEAAGEGVTLVIAADEGRSDGAFAGAAALVVESSATTVNGLRWRHVARAAVLTQRRWAGAGVGREPDARYIAHQDRSLLEQLRDNAGDAVAGIDQLAVAGDSAVKLPVADLLGVQHLAQHDGPISMGVAGPLAAIVRVAQRPSSRAAICATGSGRAVLLTVAADAECAGRFSWTTAPDAGAPATTNGQGPELPLPLESPFYARDWGFTLRLEAARCTTCGYLAFPPSQRPVCPKCQSREWVPTPLPRDATVFACTENRFLPDGFPSSLVFVLGELPDGSKYWAPMPPEVRGAQVHIGDPVRLTLRIFTVINGIAAYAMKFVQSSSVEADRDVPAGV